MKKITKETIKFKNKNKKKIIKEKNFLDEIINEYKSVNNYFEKKISKYKKLTAITDEYNNINYTYEEIKEITHLFASGLQKLGVQKGDFVSLFSENNGLWIIADQAIIKCGAVSVDRGSSVNTEELVYIINHCNSCGLILENSTTYNKLKPFIKNRNFKFIITLLDKTDTTYSFNEVLKLGKNNKFHQQQILPNDNCTILYTSGTTNKPKGILLTHYNILSKMIAVEDCFFINQGENSLHILPVWHAYEYDLQHYYILSGAHLIFTNIKNLKKDLLKYKIDRFATVPSIWDSFKNDIYKKLKQQSKIKYNLFKYAVKISEYYKNSKNIFAKTLKPLHLLFNITIYKQIKIEKGLNFRVAIFGGGTLSIKTQIFYDAIDLNLRAGYGLTEVSPVTIRTLKDKNYIGSVGKPLQGMEIKICDTKTDKELSLYKKGLIKIRGPLTMKGYYNDKENTEKLIDKNGWVNSGDIGYLTKENNLYIVGRMKDIIVLSNSENVNPIYIENLCLESPYIHQIILTGQDMDFIGALIVPNMDSINQYSKKEFKNILKIELNKICKKLKPHEKIKDFEIINEPFTIENGLLSQTSKIKRNTILNTYKDIINKMYNKK